jgi:prepilin-type N-terminal cleavage/methylation domain-containing protein
MSMMRLTRNNHIATRGFTLIEMIVSVALFSIVMVIVAAAYLNLLSLDRETRAANDVADNLNFVVDTMARSIRTGGSYYCGSFGGPDCTVMPSSTFNFVDDQGKSVKYSLISGRIMECYGASCTDTPMTDPRITVDALSFYVHGVDPGNSGNADQAQPFVTFVIHGTITIDTNHVPAVFTIETSAVQRQIDL